MLRGLANINLVAENVPEAVEWYSELLGGRPEFVSPATGTPHYAEWRFGDDLDELGIMHSAFRPCLPSPGGALVYVHVDEIGAASSRILDLGATAFDPVMQRGDGWWTASFVDPFGNLLGLIQSPHWAARHHTVTE